MDSECSTLFSGILSTAWKMPITSKVVAATSFIGWIFDLTMSTLTSNQCSVARECAVSNCTDINTNVLISSETANEQKWKKQSAKGQNKTKIGRKYIVWTQDNQRVNTALFIWLGHQKINP